MKRKKYITFEKAYNAMQRPFIATMLLNGQVEQVKYSFASRKVEYTDELAEEIKANYGKSNQNQLTKKEV